MLLVGPCFGNLYSVVGSSKTIVNDLTEREKKWFKNWYVLRKKQFTLIKLDQHIFVQIKTWFIIHYTCTAIPQKNMR